MSDAIAIRNGIRDALLKGEAERALRLAQNAAKNNPTTESWRTIQRTLRGGGEKVDALFDDRTTLRIAIASSFTAQNLAPYLDVVCLLSGINAKTYVVPYNQFQMEFRDPSSELHQFKPQVTLFLAELPELTGGIGPFASEAEFDAAVEQTVRAVTNVAEAFRANEAGHFLIHNFILPSAAPERQFDNPALGTMNFYRSVNAGLARAVARMKDVYLIDLDQLASRLGTDNAINRRMKYLARMPLSETFAQELARVLAVHFRALCGKTRKCLVMDLDNVMWGGIVGEDGVSGVAIGDEAPGNVYRDIQLAARRLYERGVILAIASKNNPEDALAVFAERKEMVLRREDFAAIEIGWGDKASALRRIAAQLNIGTDSLVFLDDSPQERLLVQTELPEVEVLPFPEDVSALPDELLRCGLFDSLTLTDEDRGRGRMYAQRQQRQSAETQATDLDAFLRSLELSVSVVPAEASDVPRVTQLTQRTNQFNLTTRRYTETDIAAMLNDPAWQVLTLSVRDRFGDEGLAGVCLTRIQDGEAAIDSFLMSCRVLGRGVEKAFIATAVHYAARAGATRVTAQFLPTKKNAQVRDFYSKHGFIESGREKEAVRYSMASIDAAPEIPAWIQMQTAFEPSADLDKAQKQFVAS